MTAAFGYALVGLAILIGFFGALIGKEKMTKIIIGSTCMIPGMLSISYIFHSLIIAMEKPGSSFATISGPQWIQILTNSEPTILAILRLAILLYIMSRVRLHVDYTIWGYDHMLASYAFLIPCLICTMAGMAGVVLLGINVFTLQSMHLLAQTFTPTVENYIVFTSIPYYLIIQSIAMLIIMTQSTITISPHDGYALGE